MKANRFIEGAYTPFFMHWNLFEIDDIESHRRVCDVCDADYFECISTFFSSSNCFNFYLYVTFYYSKRWGLCGVKICNCFCNRLWNVVHICMKLKCVTESSIESVNWHIITIFAVLSVTHFYWRAHSFLSSFVCSFVVFFSFFRSCYLSLRSSSGRVTHGTTWTCSR